MKKQDNERIPLRYRIRLSLERVRGYAGLVLIAAAAVLLPWSISSAQMDPLLYLAVMCGAYIILGGLTVLCIRDIKQSKNISDLILYDFKQKKKDN